MKIVSTFLFITFSSTFFSFRSVTTESGLGICKEKEDICCEGYYQENGTCKVCPFGWYGKNCTRKCPPNSYGELCREKCTCKLEEKCDPSQGCMRRGVCSGIDGEFRCCLNYYQSEKNKCTVCFPGTYGNNCKEICPNGTYGYLCRWKCNCGSGVACDKQFGCVDQACPPGFFGLHCSSRCPIGYNGLFCKRKKTCEADCDQDLNSYTSDEKSMNFAEIIIASVAGFIGIVGAIMVITVFKKCSRKGRQNIYDQSINLSREANEEQYDYEALQKNKEHEGGYEEPLTGRIDRNTEFETTLSK